MPGVTVTKNKGIIICQNTRPYNPAPHAFCSKWKQKTAYTSQKRRSDLSQFSILRSHQAESIGVRAPTNEAYNLATHGLFDCRQNKLIEDRKP